MSERKDNFENNILHQIIINAYFHLLKKKKKTLNFTLHDLDALQSFNIVITLTFHHVFTLFSFSIFIVFDQSKKKKICHKKVV